MGRRRVGDAHLQTGGARMKLAKRWNRLNRQEKVGLSVFGIVFFPLLFCVFVIGSMAVLFETGFNALGKWTKPEDE
jgi:hypothetical protein